MDEDNAMPNNGTVVKDKVEGKIEFKVHFSYDEKQEVLKGISLKVEPGQSVAIVGATEPENLPLLHLLQGFMILIPGKYYWMI
jgi:ABC-type multidrug transport system fused ATPase/permease subunit